MQKSLKVFALLITTVSLQAMDYSPIRPHNASNGQKAVVTNYLIEFNKSKELVDNFISTISSRQKSELLEAEKIAYPDTLIKNNFGPENDLHVQSDKTMSDKTMIETYRVNEKYPSYARFNSTITQVAAEVDAELEKTPKDPITKYSFFASPSEEEINAQQANIDNLTAINNGFKLRNDFLTAITDARLDGIKNTMLMKDLKKGAIGTAEEACNTSIDYITSKNVTNQLINIIKQFQANLRMLEIKENNNKKQ